MSDVVGMYRDRTRFQIRISYWAYMDALKAGLDEHTHAFWLAVADHQDQPLQGRELRAKMLNRWREIRAFKVK